MFRITMARCVLLACVALTATTHAMPAKAGQLPSTDPRWTPWLGCWSSESKGAYVCVMPTANAAAVELVTVSGGQITFRETVDASSERKNRISEGCDGWESGRWPTDGRHLYLRSEYRCGNGSVRTGSELFAISPAGEWIDIISVTVGENTGVRTIRRRPARPNPLPAELSSALAARPLARTEGLVAPLGFAEIIDASHQLDGAVVEAWLNEVRPKLKVDSRRLIQLSHSGVPDGAIDVLVALAYPEVFHLGSTSPFVVQSAPQNASQTVIVQPAPVVIVDPGFGRYPSSDCYFDRYRWDYCGGWVPAREVIVINGATAAPAAHGRVTKDGYQSGERADSGKSSTSETSATSSESESRARAPEPPPPPPVPERTARPR